MVSCPAAASGVVKAPKATAKKLWKTLLWGLIHLGPRRDVTVDTVNGRLSFDSKDWLIGKYIYVRRSYECDLIREVLDLLRLEGYSNTPGNGTVLDVGANIGMICIALLKHRHFERAVAFEPAPNSYRLLVKNIEQNGLSHRILHFPYALSSCEAEMELELSRDNSGDHRIRQMTGGGFFRENRRRTIRVKAKSLDRLLVEHPGLRAEQVALIWLDIQGHEGRFLEGARDLLSRGIPIVSEFWPYAILRSGMSRPEFCRIVSGLFTHYYLLPNDRPERLPISRIDSLFDEYSRPREMCTVLLVRERQVSPRL